MREMESNVRVAKKPEKPWDPDALWRTLKTAGRVMLAVAILGAGIFAAVEARKYVTTSPRFGLKDLRITSAGATHASAHHYSPDQIADIAGVKLGQNVVEIDLEAARAKLESDPWIERATITRRLPSSVAIEVVEREAAAMVALPTGTFLSTADGLLFKKLEQDDPFDLPIVTGLTLDDAGGDREATAQLVRRALELAKEIEHVGLLGGRVEELNVDRDGGVTAVIGKRAMRVVFGRGPYRPKVRLAAKIEAELIRRSARATTIFLDDDTHPERIVVRLVSALPPAEVTIDGESPTASASAAASASPSGKKLANKKGKGGAK
jgi:cell division protein FtsQ